MRPNSRPSSFPFLPLITKSLPNTVRRSGRQKIEPLEYWRNERVIYKRRQSGLGINAVVRFPRVSPDPLTKAGGKKGAKRRGTSARVKSELPGEDEEGVDDMTEPDGLVWNWEGDCETRRRAFFHLSSPSR